MSESEPPADETEDERIDRIVRNVEVWDKQKEWVVDPKKSEIAWEIAMQTVVESFTDGVVFEATQLQLQPSGKTINAAVAATPEQRAVGMTGRGWTDELAAMLFVVPQSTVVRFGTRNSPDMKIGFFDADGALLSLEQLTAEDHPTSVVEAVGARYVLEFDPARVSPDLFEGQRLVVSHPSST